MARDWARRLAAALGLLLTLVVASVAEPQDILQACRRNDPTSEGCGGAAERANGERSLAVQRDAAFTAALAAYRSGDLDRAIVELDNAIRFDPDYADAYQHRGFAFLAKGDAMEAHASFFRARSLHLAGGWRVAPQASDTPMQIVIVRAAGDCEPNCPEWISAEGKIMAGTPAALNRVLKAAGKRRLPIVIQSPGGDLNAAIAMGRAIRAKKLAVVVGRTLFDGCLPGEKGCKLPKENGGRFKGLAYSWQAYCASACPFVLAGGERRLAGEAAGVGVHQVTTVYQKAMVTYRVQYKYVKGKKVIVSKKPVSTKKGGTYSTTKLSKAERATLTKYLTGMGIDPGLVARLEKTKPSEIDVLSPPELASLRLTTGSEPGEALFDPKLCEGEAPAGYCVVR